MIEYKIIEKKHLDLKKLLNDLGKDHWELCGVYEHDFIFKRYKSDYTERYYTKQDYTTSDNDSD